MIKGKPIPNLSPLPGFSIGGVKLKIVEHGSGGLVAWASIVICGAIRLNHIALRRGNGGELFVTYPNKLTAKGNKQGYFFPISTEASEVIQEAILTRLATLAKAATDNGTQTK